MTETLMPATLAEALIKTIGEVKTLQKTEENKFANFKYVPIDGYFEIIPQVAAANGLAWSPPREIEHDFKSWEEGGKQKGMMITTYTWDVYHKSGEMVRDWCVITIPHPMQGPQTAGSSLAYAEKAFQRFLLKVVTGENDDADAVDPASLDFGDPPTPVLASPPLPQPVPHSATAAPPAAPEKDHFTGLEVVPPVPGGPTDDSPPFPLENPTPSPDTIQAIFDGVKMAVDLSTSEADLIEVWTKNQAAIGEIQREDNAKFLEVQELMKVRRENIINATITP
jgi:hypothetical protein